MSCKISLATSLRTLLLVMALGFSIAACSSPEQRALAHYESGKELLASGEYIKAGLEFRNALKFNEKLADAWVGLATVEEQKENWPVVIDSLQRVIELDAKSADARFKLAKFQLAALKLDLALKNINDANDLKKDDTNILALRAAILFRLNDREGARVDAERALFLNPDNPEAHAVLAADQMADGRTAAALRFIDRGLASDPKNPGLLVFKLKIFEDAKDDENFEIVLRQLIAANPDKRELHQTLLGFLASRNRTADFEREMRSWLAAEPNDTARALDLVRFLRAAKGPEAARVELNQLAAANPLVVEYKLALAQLDFSEKRSDAATRAIKEIISKGEPKEDVLRAQLLLASLNTELGRKDEAKVLIEDILAEDEKNADALALRANLNIESGEPDSAVADLREALNQQPNSVPLLMLLGRAHERQGATELANDRMAQAVKASNYNSQVSLDYIAFLGRRGKNDDAENVLNEAVSHNPGDPRLLKTLAQVKLNRQDWVGAQAVADALKKIGDKSGAGEQIAGAALLGQKKYDEGFEALKSAFNSAPQTVQPLYSLFLAFLQAGKQLEAEAFVQSVLVANPNNADAHVLLGSLRMMQKQLKEAENEYNLAIKVQPASPVGYVALAKHHISQQQHADAEAVLKAAREKAPQDLSVNLIYSALLEQRMDIDSAIAVYEAQLKATPDVLIVVNNLASLLADYRTDTESLDRASQLAQRLEAIDIPQFKDTVGWIAYRKGDYRTALLNLEKAVEKLQHMPLVKYHLAMTYVALKRTTDAKDLLGEIDAALKTDDPLKEKIGTTLAGLETGN